MAKCSFSIILLLVTGLLQSAGAAEIYTVNSSNNNNSDYSDFRYSYDRAALYSTRSDPNYDGSDITTNVPCPTYNFGRDCMIDSTTFGQFLAAGSSDETVTQCNGLLKRSSTFYDRTCDEGVSSMSSFPATPSITEIIHGLASGKTATGLVAGTVVPDNPGDSGYDPMIDYNDGTNTYTQSTFNNLVSSVIDNNNPSQCAAAKSNGDGSETRCNELEYGLYNILDGKNPSEHGGGNFKQDFQISFSVESLTDTDGNQVGDAEGSWSMTWDDSGGSRTTCDGTFTYDSAGGYQGEGNYPTNNCYAGNPS